MAGSYQQFKIDEHWTPLETVIDGNLAYQRGSFTVTATPKAGGAGARDQPAASCESIAASRTDHGS